MSASPSGRRLGTVVAAVRRTVAAVAAALAVAAGSSPAAAQIYRYTDEGGTAHYVEGADNVPPRYRATAIPLPYRNEPAGAADRPGQAPPAPLATIRFTSGQRIVARAHLNDSTPVQLLVDTGADRTLISPRALTAAGVSLTRGVTMQRISGVSGTLQVPRVVIDSLAVGAARVDRMGVLALDLEQGDLDGLLGRDFLERFNVSIDAGRGMVTIGPR